MKIVKENNQQGLALIVIMLIFASIGIGIFASVILIGNLSLNGKNSVTEKRMRVVQDAAISYYRGHADSWQEASVPKGPQVPVEVDIFNLESKYKMDGWGQFLYYDDCSTVSEITVDGTSVAGVIISGGPDQKIDSGNASPYTTTKDDIVMPINVTAEAIEIAYSELNVLVRKKRAALARNPGNIDNATTIVTDFGLGGTYLTDPWGNGYVTKSGMFTSAGPDGGNNTSDDIKVSW